MARPGFAPYKPKNSFTICQSASGEVACRFDVCHTLYDVYSLFILLQDVTDVYLGQTLPDARPFSEVIRHIQTTPKSQTVGFWTQFLRGVKVCQFPVLLQSSIDTQLQDDHGAIFLPQDALREATSFCQRNNITRSVFIHIAWALVLSHYTGLDQVCFGYMASGRDVPVEGIKRICGPLANLVVSRMDLRRPLGELLKSVGPMLKEHRRHQQTPLAEVRHSLGISERLFNTAVNLLRPDPVASAAANGFTFDKHLLVSPHEVSVLACSDHTTH
jgi:hypothetical protein